jgi:hypothetical protein
MVEVLRDSNISKYNILSQGLLGKCFGSEREWMRRIEEDYVRISERRRSSSDESTDPILTGSSEGHYGSTDNGVRRTENGLCECQMFPPGQIVYFEKSFLSDDQNPINVLQKSAADFSEILVTPAMISDHMPSSYIQALEYSLTR